jgi:hypothetical protein
MAVQNGDMMARHRSCGVGPEEMTVVLFGPDSESSGFWTTLSVSATGRDIS